MESGEAHRRRPHCRWLGLGSHPLAGVHMTAEQHQVLNMLVQGACETRSDLREVAWTLIGLLLLFGIIALGALAIWILHGGISRYSYCASPADRMAIEQWLRES